MGERRLDRLTHGDIDALVGRAAPGLPVERLTVLRQTSDWLVVEVNQEYVFHFAGSRAGAEWLAAENRLLAAIAGRISTRLPEPWRFATDHAFVAYRRIDGDLLGTLAFDHTLSEAAWARVAADVGRFLAELHQAIDLETAIGLRLPPPEYPKFAPDLLGRTLPLMNSEEDRALVRHVHRLLTEITPGLASPTLIHGDNLVIAADGSLLGVLDFRSALIADRHIDFRCLFGYGDIMEGAVESYNRESPVPVDLRWCQVISAANDLHEMTWRAEMGMLHGSIPIPIPVRVADLREKLRLRDLL
jgi:aminoglycoside phosphotransferase (APT) family kinase protein